MTPSPETRAMILAAIDRSFAPSNVLDLTAVFAMKKSRSSRRQIKDAQAKIDALIAKTQATRARIDAYWAERANG